VGQDEDAQPLVRRADFCRAEQACRRRVAHAPKLSQDGFKAEGNVTGDVFEENPFGPTFADDACDFWPEVTGIIGPAALACGAEGLAGISCEHNVEGSVKGSGIEGSQIIPDWRRDEIPGALGGDQDSAGVSLPFDEGASVETGLSEHEAQIKASAACAEGQSVPGT
jgi:hypothetical protein